MADESCSSASYEEEDVMYYCTKCTGVVLTEGEKDVHREWHRQQQNVTEIPTPPPTVTDSNAISKQEYDNVHDVEQQGSDHDIDVEGVEVELDQEESIVAKSAPSFQEPQRGRKFRTSSESWTTSSSRTCRRFPESLDRVKDQRLEKVASGLREYFDRFVQARGSRSGGGGDRENSSGKRKVNRSVAGTSAASAVQATASRNPVENMTPDMEDLSGGSFGEEENAEDDAVTGEDQGILSRNSGSTPTGGEGNCVEKVTAKDRHIQFLENQVRFLSQQVQQLREAQQAQHAHHIEQSGLLMQELQEAKRLIQAGGNGSGVVVHTVGPPTPPPEGEVSNSVVVPPPSQSGVRPVGNDKASTGKKRLFQCSKCDKSYNSSSALSRHITSKHKNSKFECLDCKKKFTLNSNLKRHRKRLH